MINTNRLSDIVEAKVISFAFEYSRANSRAEKDKADLNVSNYIKLMVKSPEEREFLGKYYKAYTGRDEAA